MYNENPVSPPVSLTGGEAESQAVRALAAHDEQVVIESRFGTLLIDPTETIEFSRGMLGFGEFHTYALVDIDDPRFPQVKVLQCTDDHALAFLVLPFDLDCGILDRADIATACAAVSIPIEDVAVMLVVTVRKTPDEVPVTVNLRAPLLIDSVRRVAVQFVLGNEKYPVRYPIGNE